MNIFNDFLALLIKVAVVCLLIGLCLGVWLAQRAMAETTTGTTTEYARGAVSWATPRR